MDLPKLTITYSEKWYHEEVWNNKMQFKIVERIEQS